MGFSRLTLPGRLASLDREKGSFGAWRGLQWVGALMLGAGLTACAGITPESSAAAMARRAGAPPGAFDIQGQYDA